MGDAHNIFVSWSKPRARAAARALRDWLPRVIQSTKPWMSETDIEKGKPWLDELMGALAGLKLGIVCLTPEGLSEPWVLFEVGVICRALDPETRIWTYLLGGLRHSDVPQPLGMFQHTLATKEDTLRLLQSVNQAMGERGVSEEILKDQFELRWKELDEKLRVLPAPGGPVRSTRTNEEMFGEIVEALRSAAGSGKAVEQIRDELRDLQETLLGFMGTLRPSPFFGGTGITVRSALPLTGLVGGDVNVVGPLGPGWGEGSFFTGKLSDFRPLGHPRGVEPTGTPAPGMAEPNTLTPGSPSMGGHVAVPQPGPVASPVNEQEKDEQQEEERGRMHAPSGKRAGERGKIAVRRSEAGAVLRTWFHARRSLITKGICFYAPPCGSDSHFQLANCSRRAVFLNLPTEVRGMASRKTKASGSCHFAKDFPRNSRNSSGVTLAPSFSTMAARGRSCHFG